MSQTVIFSVGAGVFALTVWGAVMAGGIWLSQLVESQDGLSLQRQLITDDGPNDARGAPGPS